MKYLRIIATFLILVMASSPVLAAVCSISCAGSFNTVDFILNDVSSDSSAMTADHCHHGVADAGKHESSKQASDKHQSNAEHKGCTMAGGCHFAQAAPASPILLLFVNYTSVTLPHFTPIALAADVPPPIKPPA
ncbi:hypothetical protein [Methylotenera sp.]|uniref:hypothetical protein n=1 Tax=Methylotenera sp. TaxID=2051956 RepID=UPI0027335B20|nr:hypothetical protein [Methylotenera sp.]MDP3004649.1 hypothetical protein [Methylotenera sp.]